MLISDFINLVDKDDTGLLGCFNRPVLDLIFIDELGGFFIFHRFKSSLYREPARAFASRIHIGKHAFQLTGHVFQTRWCHDFYASRGFRNLDFDFFLIELSLPQLLAKYLPGGGLGVVFDLDIGIGIVVSCLWQQYVQNAFFSEIFGQVLHFLHFGFTNHLDRHISKIAHYRFDVTAHIANFSKLGCLYLDEGGMRQFCQASGDFSFTHTGWANHQYILWRDFVAQIFIQLHAAPAIAKCDGNSTFGGLLANDVLVEFRGDFSGGHN